MENCEETNLRSCPGVIKVRYWESNFNVRYFNSLFIVDLGQGSTRLHEAALKELRAP